MTLALLPDRLRVGDERYPFFETPLEDYLKERPRPAAFQADSRVAMDPGRGYVAEWEMREGALWLVALLRPATTEPSPGLAELFPGAELPLLASWYSGTIYAGDGPVIGFEPMGWTRYARTRILRIEQGALLAESLVDNAPPGPLGDLFKGFGKPGS